jgi:preprotein translocase subunit SecA
MLARLEFKGANRLPEAEPEAFEALLVKYKASCAAEQAEVKALGGLHIVGTERHESRRIDNQLRGRAGRQGDPGSSRFYLSLEDDLMRIFMGDRVKNLMDRMGMPDDEPIEHPWVSKSVENAQSKVEARNFDIRKNLLEFDDVMNAQRKTIYALRQSLLQGRYASEETDELGKPTGRTREVPVDAGVREETERLVGQLLGMFTEPALPTKQEKGKAIAPARAAFETANKVVDQETLQREVYHLWGVKFEVNDRLKRTPVQIYDELVDQVSRGLSEQRERLLDLMDKVVSAMVEESCPQNRPPEDWDWKAIRNGFQELFQAPIGVDLQEFGEASQVVRVVYAQAEVLFEKKEKEFGVENFLRVFRHFYLEEIDKQWVDHLSSMEHLRDGIHLRGYGQRDPKQEYKKEGFNLFLNMVARVSSNVLTKLFEVQAEKEEIEAMEEEAAKRHLADLQKAVARHIGDPATPDKLVSAPPAAERKAAAEQARPAPKKSAAPAIRGNDPCPCGSGKNFLDCHGAVFDDANA